MKIAVIHYTLRYTKEYHNGSVKSGGAPFNFRGSRGGLKSCGRLLERRVVSNWR